MLQNLVYSCTEGRVTAKVAGAVLAAIIGLTVVTTLPLPQRG